MIYISTVKLLKGSFSYIRGRSDWQAMHAENPPCPRSCGQPALSNGIKINIKGKAYIKITEILCLAVKLLQVEEILTCREAES
jgi:uncharacterized membrane protein YecN with MAPEG domain